MLIKVFVHEQILRIILHYFSLLIFNFIYCPIEQKNNVIVPTVLKN